MRNWKSYSMAFVFAALCSVSVAGCDVSGIVADIIAGALGGDGGCVGDCASGCLDCGDCSSCGGCACDCSDCGGCDSCASCDCTTVLRDVGGRHQGFHGPGVHPGRRMANAIQGRLTESGYQFIEDEINPLINTVLPATGLDLEALTANVPEAKVRGSLYIELRNFQLFAQDACPSNTTNNLGVHDCARTTFAAYFRTCDKTGTCTAGEKIPVDLNVSVPIIGNLAMTCQLALDARGLNASTGAPAASPDSYPNGLLMRADVGSVTEAGLTARNGYGRLNVLDVQVTDTNSLQGSDVWVTCPSVSFGAVMCAAIAVGGNFISGIDIDCNCPPFQTGSCTFTPTTIIGDTITQLRGQLNPIIDAQVNNLVPPMLCYPAYHGPNGSQTGGTNATAALDCPTGTTYQAPSSGAPSATNPGKCMINGANPARCMDILAGMELRVNVGAGLAAITPGIEAVLDTVVALQGDLETINNGSTANVFAGLDGWFAGIRALPHNPCVPIEHPANNQAACDSLGSGYEYEAIPNGTFSGRCVPRIPIIPQTNRARINTPHAPAATADTRAGDADYEAGGLVSQSFINYAAWKVWDTGITCINAGTSLSPMLSPGLIALAMIPPDTQPRLFFPLDVFNDSTLANRRTLMLMLKPQTPPVITFDEIDDPCEPGVDTVMEVVVDMPQLHLDLSIWNDERYGRVGTVETDVHVVVRVDNGPQPWTDVDGCRQPTGNSDPLAIERGGIDVKIATIGFNNTHWLPDAPMLTPADFTPNSRGVLPIQAGFNTIGGLAGGIAKSFLPKINVETMVNMAIDQAGTALADLGLGGVGAIPIRIRLDHDALVVVDEANTTCSGVPWDTGTRTTDANCTNTFVGGFIDLCDSNDAACNAAGATPLTGTVETAVQVTNVVLPEERAGFDMQSENFGQGESPSVEISMSATGPADVQYEYSFKTTYTGWSDWQRSPYAVIRDPGLFLQGDLQVFAMARVAGEPSSFDRTPARAAFRIDVTAPMVQVYGDDGVAEVQALDLISQNLQYRTKDSDGDWSEWTALPASGIKQVGDVEDIAAVEVRDEDGNVASTTQALQGSSNAATSTACASCATAGAQSQTPPLSVFGGLVALGALVMRRRRR